jgi:hypothetical protein
MSIESIWIDDGYGSGGLKLDYEAMAAANSLTVGEVRRYLADELVRLVAEAREGMK